PIGRPDGCRGLKVIRSIRAARTRASQRGPTMSDAFFQSVQVSRPAPPVAGQRREGSNGFAPAPARTSAAVDDAGSAADEFEARDPHYRLGDVILPEVTQRQLATLLSRVRNHWLLYVLWKLAEIDPNGRRLAVNFYGPPGTGKTMAAESVASWLGKQ